MKKKRLLSILLVCVMLFGMVAGCGKKETPQNNKKPAQSSANEVTVAEIKQKYGAKDDGKMLPLYNLDANEPLKISLKYTPEDERSVFSIHTDEKCLKESEVMLMWGADSYMPTGPKTYEVKPIMAPLSGPTTEGLWGNVSNYYIKFNYDITAEKETKLDEPMIVPMSIKSPAEIPNVKYEVKDGNFVLKWTEVKGATSYKIYQREVIKLLETTNVAPKGKEEAFAGASPMVVAEVSADTFSYSDWMKDGNDGLQKTVVDELSAGYVVSAQNNRVNGEYYVTAVVDGKESLFSMGISTSGLSLPKEYADSSISFNTYETGDDLPKTINIKYVDGSIHAHNITYKKASSTGNVEYTIDGTQLSGVVYIKSSPETVKTEASKPENTGGAVSAENNIPQNAPTSIPTVNDGKTPAKDLVVNKTDKADDVNKDDGENKENVNKEEDNGAVSDKVEIGDKENTNSNVENKEENKEENTSGKTVVEEQLENTEKVLEEANKETIEISDDMVVNADNAAEEYLALCMISGQANISIAAFPEIQSWSILSDTLMKVIYQNPMILGVRSYGYDYGTMTLTLDYDYTQEEMAQKQAKIQAEGKKIISQIITNGMSDEQKRRAIYDYLEKNTSYDDGALASAEANNFMGVDDEYKDSFSTYGILVNKVGVCQSYAYTYDYLCELANVECITVTGNMYGYLPHAWNKVLIDGEWYTTDVTNNEKSTGIKDFMYENPDQVAYAFCYIEDDMYYTNAEAGKYKGTKTDYSKYKECIVENDSELTGFVKNNAKAGSELELLATYEDFDSSDVTSALREAGVRKLGSSIVLGGYVWMEIEE